MQPHEPDHTTAAALCDSENGSSDAAAALAELRDEHPSHRRHSHVPVKSARIGPRLAFLVLVIAAGLGIGFWLRYHHNAAVGTELASTEMADVNAPSAVDVVRVEYGSPSHVLTLPGDSRAWYESTIYARVSGYVKDWKLDIGAQVHEGQVLADIDTPDLDDQLAAAQAQVAASQSQVKVAEANANFARTTNKRWQESPKGVVSEQERDEKESEYLSSVAKLQAAQSQVELNTEDVNRLKALEQFKKVTAPYDGVITKREIDIGDLVTAGSTSSTSPLYSLAKEDKIRVFVDVPQWASGDIKDGMPATMTAQQYPQRQFIGTVARNSHAIDPAAKTLNVEVDVDNKDLALLPGMYLEVNFKTSDDRPALQVPASALNFRSGGPEVAVVSADGRVQFHKVTIARDLGDLVEIGSGVVAGDMVALNISNQIADGDRVTPQPVEQSPNPAPNGTVAAR